MEAMAHELTPFIDTANVPLFGVNTDGLINEWNPQMVQILATAKMVWWE